MFSLLLLRYFRFIVNMTKHTFILVQSLENRPIKFEDDKMKKECILSIVDIISTESEEERSSYRITSGFEYMWVLVNRS